MLILCAYITSATEEESPGTFDTLTILNAQRPNIASIMTSENLTFYKALRSVEQGLRTCPIPNSPERFFPEMTAELCAFNISGKFPIGYKIR